MSGNLKVIYMAGGAEYTIWPLESVINSKHTLLHVYTKCPRPAGRGKKIIPNALQNFLDENKLSYSMPINLKSNIEIEKHLESLGFKVLLNHWPDTVFYRI